jgi:hypothetical protein
MSEKLNIEIILTTTFPSAFVFQILAVLSADPDTKATS